MRERGLDIFLDRDCVIDTIGMQWKSKFYQNSHFFHFSFGVNDFPRATFKKHNEIFDKCQLNLIFYRPMRSEPLSTEEEGTQTDILHLKRINAFLIVHRKMYVVAWAHQQTPVQSSDNQNNTDLSYFIPEQVHTFLCIWKYLFNFKSLR